METNIFKSVNDQLIEKKSKTRPVLTDIERGLCHDVADGFYDAYALIHIFYNYKQFQLILIWLKHNNIRGMKLVQWIREEHDNSPMSAGIYILKKIEKDIHRKRISVSNDLKKPQIRLV